MIVLNIINSLFFSASERDSLYEFRCCVNIITTPLFWTNLWTYQWWLQAASSTFRINNILNTVLGCNITILFLVISFWFRRRRFRCCCSFTETSLEVDILRGAGRRFCNNQTWELTNGRPVIGSRDHVFRQPQTCKTLITPVMWVVAAGGGWGVQPLSLEAGLVFPHQGQLLGLDVQEALVIWAAAVWGLGLLGVVPLGLCSPSPSLPRPLQDQLSGRRLVHNPDTGGRQTIQEPVVVQDKAPREKNVESSRPKNLACY